MQPLTIGTEASLRFLWWRNPRGRFVDLGAFDQRQLRKPLQLGLVEIKTGARGRTKARLTPAGIYYARLLAAVPPRAIRRPAAPVERLPLFALAGGAR